ncbi:hypothetical protein LS482_00715 [Sinomicrobium kalidii]|uniref:hypothetical protein n=1 Tax=Sinomicrobium kalidii TaxID=2900738 RepID=UPI001E322422|nr:hypothetical protein [Sinomicrobium kalidii]UGU16405.1 hypothetical protein LS482_00715 [Sinomicrobium kalidii]
MKRLKLLLFLNSGVVKASFLWGGMVLLFSGCSDDDRTNSYPVPFSTFETDNHCSLKNADKSENEVFLRIENTEDWEAYVECPEAIEVDFESYFVLAGHTKLTACGFLKEQEVLFNNGTLEYMVAIEEQDCQMPAEVPYFAIISREYTNAPLNINVSVIKN